MKNILIVDDNLDDLQEMKALLEKQKCVVRIANNGIKALDYVLAEKFSVIIIDIMMPTLSGYDLLRLMKERVKGKVKIIYASVIPKKEVNMEGVDGFIQKPFSKQTLLKAIK